MTNKVGKGLQVTCYEEDLRYSRRRSTDDPRAMFEFLIEAFCLLGHLFEALYNADDREEARRITIGCALILMASVTFFALCVGWRRWNYKQEHRVKGGQQINEKLAACFCDFDSQKSRLTSLGETFSFGDGPMLETSVLHFDVRTFDDKTHKVVLQKTNQSAWKAFAQVDGQVIQGGIAEKPRVAMRNWESAYETRFHN